MIEFDTVTLERGGRVVLEPLSLSMTERRIGVIGANGSGKSSFARLLNGLLLPTSGAVRVFGLDTAQVSRDVRRRVGFVFQNPDNQIVYPGVAEDLAFGLKPLKLGKAETAQRVTEALSEAGLSGFDNRLTHELSGGEKQMVAIAGVMILRPDILVLDEPTTLLDRRNKRRVMEAVETMRQSVVMITHDLDLLDGFDRVLVFERGRLVADAPPRQAIPAYIEITS